MDMKESTEGRVEGYGRRKGKERGKCCHYTTLPPNQRLNKTNARIVN